MTAASLHNLPLAAQVGQLILGRIQGTILQPDDAAMLRDCQLGGVVLFADNFGTVEETRALTAQIQAICGQPGLPAIIAVDQEGGRVRRLHPPATAFPSAMALGATRSTAHAHQFGLATARELRSLGVNVNFAPVLDVNNNPGNPVIGTRSYGADPHAVATLACAVAAGLQAGGIAPTGKHFPGHGDTATDSHLALPVITGDRHRLDTTELVPFRAAIAAGLPTIMTSHIVFPALDPTLPCTLSPRLLSGLLRDELGFQGVIVSDALNMQAIVAGWGIPEGTVRFIEAGGDLAEPISDDRPAYQALLAAVATGRISSARLAASLDRLTTLRQWLAAQSPADPNWLGAPEHQQWATAIARDAVTLLRDEANLLPLARNARLAVVETFYQWTYLNTAERPKQGPLATALADYFPHLTGVQIDGQEPTPAERDAAYAAIQTADVVVFGTRGTNRFLQQAQCINDLLTLGKPTLAIALVDPYDTLAYPAVPTALATYGSDPAMLAAVSAVLAGESTAHGHAPVTIAASTTP